MRSHHHKFNANPACPPAPARTSHALRAARSGRSCDAPFGDGARRAASEHQPSADFNSPPAARGGVIARSSRPLGARMAPPSRLLLLGALVSAIALAALGAPTAAVGRPTQSPGAACECRCCWPIRSGRVECTISPREFLLPPAECRTGCTKEACKARFGHRCHVREPLLKASCRRLLPRAVPLLLFLAAAGSLLALAMVRAGAHAGAEGMPLAANVSQELDQREFDILSPQSSYGATKDAAVSADAVPFLLEPPPDVGATTPLAPMPAVAADELDPAAEGSPAAPGTPEVPFLRVPSERSGDGVPSVA